MALQRSPIALVTGATRGVGKGVATALLARGMRAYSTGRSIVENDDASAQGRCFAMTVDHADDRFGVVRKACRVRRREEPAFRHLMVEALRNLEFFHVLDEGPSAGSSR